MELSYTQKNNMARATVKLKKASELIQEADALLDVLCKEAIVTYLTVEDFEAFVELIPPESFHNTEMKVRLNKMKVTGFKAGQERNVHINHCCYTHGCKYGEDDTCPVVQMEAPQRYQCEECMTNYQDMEFKHIVVNDDGVFK